MSANAWKAMTLFTCSVVFQPRLMQAVVAEDGLVVLTTRPAEGLPPATQEFASPSGAYRLVIQAETVENFSGESKDDVAAFGSKSHCRLMRGSSEVWHKKLPYVMSDVIVTDQGFLVGVAFQHRPLETRDWTRHLILVILDAAGDELLCEKHAQAPNKGIISSFPPAPLLPNPMQVSVSPELDRVVFWLHENSTACGKKFGEQVFRVHELSTGSQKAIVYHDQVNLQPETMRNLHDVHHIASSDLLMLRYVHSKLLREQKKFEYQGESFELIDGQGLVVWQTYIDNSSITQDPKVRPTLGHKVQHLNCSRVTSTKSGFVIENGATGSKSEYRITREKSGWVVAELKPASSQPLAISK